jgi:hypothetical protein
MNWMTRVTTAIVMSLMVPMTAAAEMRRVELKTLGMD